MKKCVYGKVGVHEVWTVEPPFTDWRGLQDASKKAPILLVFQKRPHSTILLVFVSFLKIKGKIYLEHICFDKLFECQMELKLQVNYIFDEFSEQRYMEIYD